MNPAIKLIPSMLVSNNFLIAIWDDRYHMDDMSQSVLSPKSGTRSDDGAVSVAASPEYAKFRSAVESVAAFVPQASVLPMLDELIHEQIQKELTQLSARPDWLRGQLNLRGDAITAELLVNNRDNVAGTAYVCETFGIPRSTLHREKDAGTVIAYRPRKDAEFVFPLEQFIEGGVQSWAADIVAAVGNGAPAIHSLYIPRKQLDGASLGTLLRTGGRGDIPVLMHDILNRITRGE